MTNSCLSTCLVDYVRQLFTIDVVSNTNSYYFEQEVIRYRFYSNATKKHDIALLRLANRVQFSEDIFPACLQSDPRDEPRNVRLFAYGWRDVSEDSKLEFRMFLRRV